MENLRVRFAPSPSGPLHVGNARTALFNHLYARSLGGKFILRIEDTDKTRSNKEAVEQVFESLRWMGLDWDEGPEVGGPHGPYFQSERQSIYKKYLNFLLEKEKAYPCFCKEAELKSKKEKQLEKRLPPIYDQTCRGLKPKQALKKMEAGEACVFRLKVGSEEIKFQDQVRGSVKIHTNLFGDFVLMRSDGSPTYQFAVVVDDVDMKISHIIRGEDHLSNTPKQILLFNALNALLPVYFHLSTILGGNREKLSKREGAASVLEFRRLGYLPDAFINYLALLGWSPPDEELMSRENLLLQFKNAKFTSSPAIFDYSKLDYFNGHALRQLDEGTLYDSLLPFLKEEGFVSEEIPTKEGKRVKEIVLSLKNHCKRLSDIVEHTRPFLGQVTKPPQHILELIEKNGGIQLLKLAFALFSKESNGFVDETEFLKLKEEAKKSLGIGGKKFFLPLRIAFTGLEHGPDLDLIFRYVERTKLLKRLEQIIN